MKKKFSFLGIFFGFALLIFSLFFTGETKSSEKLLEVDFLDVGQGDSTLIKTPFGQNILIDGGPDDIVLDKLDKFLPWWDRTINLMILTHPHADHLDGLIYVLKHYKVEQILYTGVLHTTDDYLEWLNLIKENNIPLKIIDCPQKIILSKNSYLQILYPFESFQNKRVKNLNNTSIAGILVFKNAKFFIAGDIEEEVERELLKKYNNLNVDVFKANHHGSKTSNTDKFIDALNPRVVVFTVGKDNQFAFPHKEVFDRFRKRNIDIYRTDYDGDTTFYSDGNTVFLKN